MFCNNCGSANADNAPFCVNCGSSMVAPTAVVHPASTTGAATAPAPAVPAPQSAWLAPQPPKTSGKAVAALILGIINALCLFVGFPFAILAVIFGHMGRTEVKQSQGTMTGAGMATTGLVLGYMSAPMVLIALIAAVAIPNLLHLRRSANEASTAATVRTINTACITYSVTYPKKGFPASLEVLGSAQDGRPASEDAAALIDQQLASGEKNGYAFVYIAGPPNADGLITSYTVRADPVNEEAGNRHYFTDESGIVRVEDDAPATVKSPPL